LADNPRGNRNASIPFLEHPPYKTLPTRDIENADLAHIGIDPKPPLWHTFREVE